MAANSGKQRSRGRPFPKGVSGNPTGRPKSFGEYIRAQTQNGQEMVDFALKILRAEKAIPREARIRLEAASWLHDRAYGKPVQSTEVSVTHQPILFKDPEPEVSKALTNGHGIDPLLASLGLTEDPDSEE